MIRRKTDLLILVLVFNLVLILPAICFSQISPETKKLASWLAGKPYISEIIIEGNDHYSNTQIKSRLFSIEKSSWHFLRGDQRNRVLRYSANRDTLEVKYLYLMAGFLNVKIAETYRVDTLKNDSSAIVRLIIEEGERFLISQTGLEANRSLPFHSDLLEPIRQFKPGDPVNPVILNKAVFYLKTIFANNGYPYAEVGVAIDSSISPSRTAISFDTREGPLVHFGELEIKKLNKYQPFLVEREITFNEGELYSRKKIIDSQKRLYSTGLFYTINLDIDKRDKSSRLTDSLDQFPDFSFSAIERKPHFVSIKTGAGQDPQQDLIWDFSTAWGKRNFLRSRRLELSFKSRYIVFTQWRPLMHRFQIRFTEPWFFGIRMPMTLTARYEPGVRSQVQPYRIQKWSTALSTRKEWSDQLYATISGEYENVNIYGIEGEEKEAIQDTIRVRRKLTFSLIRDTRIDKFVPKSGSFSTTLVQFVGGFLGGEDSFIKLEYSWARYQRAIGRAVYATRIKVGWVKEYGQGRSVPTEDRFYLGGANSIRGFRENSIGPRDDEGVNTGANAYAIFNQELRFPLFWKFWGSFFADMGNGWESFTDVDVETILFAYGVGLQILSPAGPIRLDYAHRLENGIYHEDDRFHITILYAF